MDRRRTGPAKSDAIERDHNEAQQARERKTILGRTFEHVAELVRSPEFDLNSVWDNASDRERRVMVEELIEAVTIHADRLEVTVTGLTSCAELASGKESDRYRLSAARSPAASGSTCSALAQQQPKHHLLER